MGSLSFCGEKASPKSLMADSHHYMRSHFSEEKHLAYDIYIGVILYVSSDNWIRQLIYISLMQK